MITMSRNPTAERFTMAAPAMPPEEFAPVNPHDTLTAPLAPSPSLSEIPKMAAVDPAGDTESPAPARMSATPSPKPNAEPVRMSALSPQQERNNSRLMSLWDKDDNPYGSPQNHPGFLGKILHGLNVATGGVGRRHFEEKDLEKRQQDLSREQSEESLRSSQAAVADAATKHTNAETAEVAPNADSNRILQGAEATHLGAETGQIQNPKAKWSIHDTEDGPVLYNESSGDARYINIDGTPIGPKLKLTQSQPIMGPDGKPHTYMLDQHGNKAVDLGVHYERPAVSVGLGQDRFDAQQRAAALKLYEPALDSAERFNVMSDSYGKATKGDQQAMLNLLANHLGMTMGLQKGARLSRDIINEAEKSQPWLQGLKAHFDQDGYLSGVALSPRQMKQMVDLGRARFAEDYVKSKNEAGYLGSTDGGPARTPNPSVINYYIAAAGGDPARARDLAAKDGWSVK